MLSMLKIGKIELEFPVIAAPLSGYTDTAMRMLNRRFGCELTFGGLMLDKSTAYRKVLRKPEFQVIPEDHPVGGQICGTEPEVMAKAAVALTEYGYDLVDLNFACPAPKVVRRGRGGALMQEPEVVKAIIERVRDAVSCPLSIKIRRGYNNSPESLGAFWQICESAVNAGVDAIYVHGRTTMQRYHGESNWEIIGELKSKYPQAVIIGSGDLMTGDDIARRMAETKIDGVIAARGMIGNPWIFQEAKAALAGEPKPVEPTLEEQYEVLTDHLGMILQYSDEHGAIRYFRKFLSKYARRHPKRKKLIVEAFNAGKMDAFRAVLKKWYIDQPDGE